MILDSLRYWATEMHVDGFRFDLASVLSRDASGAVLPNPPIVWDIESAPELAGTKLIAEQGQRAHWVDVARWVSLRQREV
jgi:glycogen operon protein